MIDQDKLLTALAGVLVILPNAAGTISDLQLTPTGHFVLLVLSLIGAAILKQTQPVGASGLSDEDVQRIAAETFKLRLEAAKERRAARG